MARYGAYTVETKHGDKGKDMEQTPAYNRMSFQQQWPPAKTNDGS